MLEEHLGYVADRVRLEQFKTAIARVLKTGDHVIDLGGSVIQSGKEYHSLANQSLNYHYVISSQSSELACSTT